MQAWLLRRVAVLLDTFLSALWLRKDDLLKRCTILASFTFLAMDDGGVLIFEDEAARGCADALDAEKLREMLRSDSSLPLPNLVILSACHSEAIGRVLEENGVPHIIAVRHDSGVTDEASLVFLTSLVSGLIAGDTVKTAFDKAQVDIQCKRKRPHLSAASRARQRQKFILLGACNGREQHVNFFQSLGCQSAPGIAVRTVPERRALPFRSPLSSDGESACTKL